MIWTHLHNLTNDTLTTIEWHDDNNAKAFMFDLAMNEEFDLSYLKIERSILSEDSYEIYVKTNETRALGGIIELDFS